jgi:lysophospholipase L1-like esterase
VTVHLVIAGDATSADSTGWGGAFACLLKTDAACVNLSRGGKSSAAYRAGGCWNQCLLLQPDYVLIQFGHNDELGHAGAGQVDPTAYRDNLLHDLDEARATGVKPILITPMARRQFGPDGKIHSSLEPYADAARALAAEQHVPLVDLHSGSIELYEKLGPDGCRDLSFKKRDGTFDAAHLSPEGAKAIAPLVVDEVKKAVPELASHFK